MAKIVNKTLDHYATSESPKPKGLLYYAVGGLFFLLCIIGLIGTIIDLGC